MFYFNLISVLRKNIFSNKEKNGRRLLQFLGAGGAAGGFDYIFDLPLQVDLYDKIWNVWRRDRHSFEF
jgi:hypothetical protein